MSSTTTAAVTDPAEAPPARSSRVAGIARSVWTVFEFEFKKSRTWKRMLVWAGVSVFPALIISLMLFAGDSLPREAWVSVVFVMACEMVVILNALLWVAPIVQTELEGKTWLYVVTRPYGRICLVTGKLLNGLVWTLGAGLLSLALVGAVAWVYALPIEAIAGVEKVETRPMTPEERQQAEFQAFLEEQFRRHPQLRRQFERWQKSPDRPNPFPGLVIPPEFNLEDLQEPEAAFESLGDVLDVGGRLIVLAILSGLAYSSLFCGIGCIVPKRAMLIAFSYTLIFEAVVAFVPAIINRLTIQYHLRCLLNRWVDLRVPLEGQELFFSNWPARWHLAVLGGMVVVWQIVSLLVIHFRQYVMTDET
ncbi:MAG TPA: ABC transporter permease [Caulifigura sp.]|nr:ABC transporter permease [Caulifigura sp.]